VLAVGAVMDRPARLPVRSSYRYWPVLAVGAVMDRPARLPVRSSYRYWPVLATVSIDRPASVPCLPDTSVRM
jgi:hypothetical protein